MFAAIAGSMTIIWWTQTKGAKNEIRWPFEIKITRERTCVYQVIARQADELRRQGLSWVKVAQKLGVSDKTAKKAASRTKGDKSADGII